MTTNTLTAYLVVTDSTKSNQIIGWQTIQYNEGDSVPTYTPPIGYTAYYLPDMSDSQWQDYQHNQNGCGGGLAYEDGKIIPYSAPVVQPPIKDQARSAMTVIQQKANLVSAMGQTFGPKMREYVTAVSAIADGTDTKTTVLPSMPSDATN